jgi:hypothetical protein
MSLTVAQCEVKQIDRTPERARCGLMSVTVGSQLGSPQRLRGDQGDPAGHWAVHRPGASLWPVRYWPQHESAAFWRSIRTVAQARRPGPPLTRFPAMLSSVHRGPGSSATWADRNGWVSADTREPRRMRPGLRPRPGRLNQSSGLSARAGPTSLGMRRSARR